MKLSLDMLVSSAPFGNSSLCGNSSALFGDLNSLHAKPKLFNIGKLPLELNQQ